MLVYYTFKANIHVEYVYTIVYYPDDNDNVDSILYIFNIDTWSFFLSLFFLLLTFY